MQFCGQNDQNEQIIQEYAVIGISDIWRCGCGLHPGREAAAGCCSEDPAQGCDSGDI